MASWLGKSGVAIVCDQLTAGGKAVLQKAIRRAGWQIEQFSVCRWDDIPANTRALIACGDRALEELTGWKGGKRASAYTRGYLLPSYTGLPVVPTFDPSKVAMGQMKLLGLVMNDLGVALQAAAGTRKICVDPKAVVNYRVGLQALKDLYVEAAANPELLVAFDLETATSWEEDEDESIEFSRDAEGEDDSAEELGEESMVLGNGKGSVGGLSRDALNIERAGIRTVQFSLHPGTGISCDWSDECRAWVQRIMSLPNPFAGHNSWLFDEPILRNHGIEIKEGTHDTLWMWHHLQPDLPAHLQGVSSLYGMPFPWKHLSGADLDFYGAADVDAVQRIMLGLPVALRRLGLLDGYERYVRDFRPMLAAMERRGIPVSKTKLEELRTWLAQEITRMDSELQPMIPSEWKGRKYWKTWPADLKPLVKELKEGKSMGIRNTLEAEGKRVTKKALAVVIKPGELCQAEREQLTTTYGYGWEGDLLYKEVDFNPRSSQQILSYIKAKGYPVPLRFKDKEETTSDKELERLEAKTKDPVLTLVRGIRAYSKMGNAYAGKLRDDGSVEGGWYPGPDGRLRATFTFGPATAQLAARSPNVLTLPKRRPELAKRFRECIVAERGHKIIELDMRAFHAKTTGLAAKCDRYMRLSDLDIHSFVAGHLVHFPGIETCLDMNDTDLKAYLTEIKKEHKKVRDFKAKPSILGIGFKMGARRLYFENRDSFANEAEARKLLDLVKSLFPKVFAWQDWIVDEADRAGKLINSWNFVRWFWDVKRWTMKDGRWVSVSSRDAEKAVAFLPSSNAHCMLRDKLLQMNDKGWLDKYGLVDIVHDAVIFHCPDRYVEEAIFNVKECLEAPVMQLADPDVAEFGFRCAAEASVGPDWGNLEEVK